MKRSEVYQSAINQTMTPEHKAVGATLIENLLALKLIHSKFHSKQLLTDDEVKYGIKFFAELSFDISDTGSHVESAIQALDISLALRFIAKERNLCLTN